MIHFGFNLGIPHMPICCKVSGTFGLNLVILRMSTCCQANDTPGFNLGILRMSICRKINGTLGLNGYTTLGYGWLGQTLLRWSLRPEKPTSKGCKRNDGIAAARFWQTHGYTPTLPLPKGPHKRAFGKSATTTATDNWWERRWALGKSATTARSHASTTAGGNSNALLEKRPPQHTIIATETLEPTDGGPKRALLEKALPLR